MGKRIALLVIAMGLAASKAVVAAPHLTLSPAAGNYNTGNQFSVTVGVDSGTEKSAAVDAWVTFDSSKLEVVSVVKAGNPAFPFALGQNIHNSEGKFDISCTSTDMSTYEATAIAGDLAVVTFKAKAEGVAAVSFSCSSGSSIDTNIFNTQAVDVIDCSSNQSGSYTITAGSSSESPTSTPTPTTASSTTTTTTSTLPQTGTAEKTIGLLVFGVAAVIGAMVLRWL